MAKRTTITIDIAPDTKKKLAKAADEAQVKLSVVVRWAISSFLRNNSKEKAA